MLEKLAGQTAVYGISSVLARLFNFLLTPYLTRIMTDTQYGAYVDMYAVIPFLLIVLTMGMESGYFRFAGKAQTAQEKRAVFSTTWGAVSLVSVIFMALVLLFKPQLASAMGYADSSSYIWIVGLIVMFDSITAIPYAKLRQEGRAGRYVIIRTVSTVINIVLCVFFYSVMPRITDAGLFPTPNDPGYAFVANLVSSAFVLVALIPSCDRMWPKINPKLFRKILLYSLPLLISGIAGTANEFIDRQMIKYLMPAGEAMGALGVYGATVKLAVIMTLFTQMYRLGAEPFFLAEFKQGEFEKTNAAAMKYYVLVSVFIFLVIALFADLFGLILGRDFREGTYILPLVLVSNVLSGIVLNLSFWYKQSGRTWMAIYVTGTGLVFTVVFNIMLVPKLGYYGAAIARLICEAAMVAISYILSRRYCRIPYDLRRIGEYVLVGAALYGAGMLLQGITMWARYFLYFILILIFAYYAVRREKIDVKGILKAMLRTVKK